MTRSSNIAPAINAEHEKATAAQRAAVTHAIECGRLLNEAKATVPHGKWEAWMQDNCTFAPRTAQLYMRAFKHLSTDPEKAQRVADFSLREIDSYLARLSSPAGTAKPARQKSERAQFDELRQLWFAARPRARRMVALELRDRGDITDAELERWVTLPDLQDYEAG